MAPRAPKELSKEAQRIWRGIVSTYEMEDEPSLLFLLRQALEAFDRMREAQALVGKIGVVIVNPTTKVVRLNPAVGAERDARMAMLKFWKAMNLDVEPPGPIGRPPGR
jgi:phage terminase small subunit